MWFSAVGLNSTQITDIIFAQIEQFICNIETVRYDCIKIKTKQLILKRKVVCDLYRRQGVPYICLITISLSHRHLKQLKMSQLSHNLLSVSEKLSSKKKRKSVFIQNAILAISQFSKWFEDFSPVNMLTT